MVDKSILLIEEELNLRHTLALILEHAGYAVSCVEKLTSARELFQEQNFDLIFLDLNSPNRYDSDELTSLPGREAGIPIVLLSGDLQPPNLNREHVYCLQKPANPLEILNMVKRTLAVKTALSPIPVDVPRSLKVR